MLRGNCRHIESELADKQATVERRPKEISEVAGGNLNKASAARK